VLDVHRRGEARANLSFSARQVRSFCRAFRVRLPRRVLWGACASMMEAARASI
jgi:hypothetical protein